MVAAATLPGVLQTGTHAARPAATAVASGSLYSCTTHSLVYQSDGSSWSTWATLGGTGSALTVKDEGSNLDTAVTSIDFVGSGVVATNASHAVTVTVSGGGGGGTPVESAAARVTAYSLFR